MTNKNTVVDVRQANHDGLIDAVKRIGVGLLYAGTDLGQNDIAQIMGIGDKRVNDLLKGIKKPNKKK